MAYTKRAAKGTLLKVTVASVLTTVPGVTSFDYPRGSADRIDATSHDSAGNRKEYVAGLIDPPSFDVPIIWDNKVTDGSAVHAAIEAAYKNGTSLPYSVTTVDAKVYASDSLVTNISFGAPVDGVFVATVTFQPTGAETVT
jgi:predicted secreted protein